MDATYEQAVVVSGPNRRLVHRDPTAYVLLRLHTLKAMLPALTRASLDWLTLEVRVSTTNKTPPGSQGPPHVQNSFEGSRLAVSNVG